MTRLRGDPWLFALAGATAVVEGAASIIRHVHLQSGLDLALADQAVWHYSRFETPYSSILHKNVLGDHFSPLVAVLAPLYWLWSDPRMLLIAQSVLIAASIVPVFLFAQRRLARAGAYLLAAAYAAFWGTQVGALYDFHDLAFTPLLVATAILLADDHEGRPSARRWAWFWLVIVLLLAVKEDLSIFVIFLGIYLLARRELRHGAALVVVGIAWYELVTRVFIPDLAGGMPYAHWTYQELGKNLPDALWTLARAPWRVLTIGFSPAQKVHTIAGLLAPFLFLSLGSRLFIVALPLLAERFLSTDPNFWNGHLHYSLSIAPVLAMAAAGGLDNVSALLEQRRRAMAVLVGTAVMLAASLAITKLGSRDSALSAITRPSFYNTPSYVVGAYQAMRHTPSQVALATIDYVLPHVSHRREVRLIEPGGLEPGSYLITNVTQPVCCSVGYSTYAARGRVIDRDLAAMTPIYYNEGWVVARRPASGQPPANGALAPLPGASARQVSRTARILGEAYGRLPECFGRWFARDPIAETCFVQAALRFGAGQIRLASVVDAALAVLRGGCRQLALTALTATDRLALDLRSLASTTALPDRRAFQTPSVALGVDVNDRDLGGQLERFVILCTPRISLIVP